MTKSLLSVGRRRVRFFRVFDVRPQAAAGGLIIMNAHTRKFVKITMLSWTPASSHR